MSEKIYCHKLKKEAEKLSRPPMPGEFGLKIQAEISKEAWGLWLAQQTILINENRLNLADATAREFLRHQMQLFLFEAPLEGNELAQPPTNV